MSETLDLFADLPEMKAGPTLDLALGRSSWPRFSTTGTTTRSKWGQH
jgi:hypothetical protein